MTMTTVYRLTSYALLILAQCVVCSKTSLYGEKLADGRWYLVIYFYNHCSSATAHSIINLCLMSQRYMQNAEPSLSIININLVIMISHMHLKCPHNHILLRTHLHSFQEVS